MAESKQFDAFQQRVAVEYSPSFGFRDQLINNALGLVGESGEVADLVKKQVYIGRGISRDDYVEEIGDTFWHLACLMNVLGLTFDEVVQYNKEKLERRYK